jgi:hypothetical protein
VVKALKTQRMGILEKAIGICYTDGS